MLYCRDCGQCAHINMDNFIEYRYTNGWETIYVDCENLETIDWGDAEITDSDHDRFECPNCGSEDIDDDWDGDEDDARFQRDSFEVGQRQRQSERDIQFKKLQEINKSKDPERTWDVDVNV